MSTEQANTSPELIVMSQSDIQVAAAALGEDDTTFAKLLGVAAIFYQANLTPVFLYNPKSGVVETTSVEKLRKLYH